MTSYNEIISWNVSDRKWKRTYHELTLSFLELKEIYINKWREVFIT